MITKFNLMKYTAIFSEKGKVNIAPGCAHDIDEDPKLIASFDSLAAAKEELDELQSEICTYGAWGHGGREYRVTEYGISEDYYNEDGEWQDHNGVWEFSKFKIDIVAGYNDETVMQCGDMKSALKALAAYEEAWIDSCLELNSTWDGSTKVVDSYGDVMSVEYVTALMDDELRERLHNRLAPCLDQEFFNAYCREHEKKFGKEFMSV